MHIELQPGSYVVAVSGGVDSVVLLHILATNDHLPTTNYQFGVAHYDHGIRENSEEDRRFVGALAKQYGLPYVYDEGDLGPNASEEAARKARYKFLHTVQVQMDADAIITAHHQDDVIETAIINLLRGTGRKGLSSLRSRDGVVRPLLHIPKAEILVYAKKHGLTWHEDSTNKDTRYLRNYVRLQIVPKLDSAKRTKLLDVIEHAKSVNTQIDDILIAMLHTQPEGNTLERHRFIMLPHAVSMEVMAAWLRHVQATFDARGLMRLTIAAKTYAPGHSIDVDRNWCISVHKKTLALTRRDR